jgi:hypothetical protein
MILPNFKIPNLKNDKLYQTYDFEFSINTRGFRDSEWPDDLVDAIWCLGDSYTFGTASPIDETWVSILQNKLNRRCVNISMPGASNEWITRRASEILETVQPKVMILHWTHCNRAELKNSNLNDFDRRDYYHYITIEDQLFNFKKCINQISDLQKNTNVIHSFSPQALPIMDSKTAHQLWQKLKGSDWPEQFNHFEQFSDVAEELKNLGDYDNFFNYSLK